MMGCPAQLTRYEYARTEAWLVDVLLFEFLDLYWFLVPSCLNAYVCLHARVSGARSDFIAGLQAW